MAEYIDREALKNDIAKSTEPFNTGSVFRAINRQPAVDVVPVQHGRWEEADWVEPDCRGFVTIITPKAALRCSNCKNCFKKELLWKDNYCPNCGAKMGGGNNDDSV